MHTISGFKSLILIRKILIGLFFAVNLILSFFFESNPCLMKYVTVNAFMSCAFGEKFLFNLCILITELLSICSLFMDKSIYKLICNIILHIMCITDIGCCIYYIINHTEPYICAIEIIIDLVFMSLILYDIIMVNKENKQEKILMKEYLENNDFDIGQ